MTHGAALNPRTWFIVLIALLPLHTLYLDAWISWKPWLVVLAAVAVADLWTVRGWPWSRMVTVGFAIFLLAILVSWPGPGAAAAFWRLSLALAAGGLLLLVVGRHGTDMATLLRVAFWSGAAMAASGVVLALITNGVFGVEAVTGINEAPGIDRVNKPAYLMGFVALTNWHQDPGYAALWTNVWFVLSGHAWLRGAVAGPRWLGPMVLGGLAAATVLTLSRTGWIGLVVGATALLVSTRVDWRRSARLLGVALVACLVILGALYAVDPEDVGNDMATSVWFRLANLVELGEIEVDEEDVIPGLDPGDNRLEVWSVYWQRFVDVPVRGTGLGSGWAEVETQEPHNLWLQLLAESGLVGLAGFMVLVFVLVRSAGRPGPVAGAVLCVIGLASFTQTVLFEPVLWFGLGLWSVQARKARLREPGGLAPI